MEAKELLRIVEKQEEVLKFEHFSNEDACDVGMEIVKVAKEKNLCPAISIRLHSGYTVFQYGFNGTGMDHANWMDRKENMVKVKGCSSLKAGLLLEINQLDMKEAWFLDPMEYSVCGGAFPIYVKNVGVIGTILVSGISVLKDHELIIEGLRAYMKITNLEKTTKE